MFTPELFTSQVFTSDSVELVVEVAVSYAFEVVSLKFTKKETEQIWTTVSEAAYQSMLASQR